MLLHFPEHVSLANRIAKLDHHQAHVLKGILDELECAPAPLSIDPTESIRFVMDNFATNGARLISRHGEMLAANAAALSIMGATAGEVVGHDIRRGHLPPCGRSHTDSCPIHCIGCPRAALSHTWNHYDKTMLRFDSKFVPCHIEPVPIIIHQSLFRMTLFEQTGDIIEACDYNISRTSHLAVVGLPSHT